MQIQVTLQQCEWYRQHMTCHVSVSFFYFICVSCRAKTHAPILMTYTSYMTFPFGQKPITVGSNDCYWWKTDSSPSNIPHIPNANSNPNINSNNHNLTDHTITLLMLLLKLSRTTQCRGNVRGGNCLSSVTTNLLECVSNEWQMHRVDALDTLLYDISAVLILQALEHIIIQLLCNLQLIHKQQSFNVSPTNRQQSQRQTSGK